MDRILPCVLALLLLTILPLTPSSISVLTGVRSDVVALAESYLGVPYLYGGVDEDGVDCSGLVYAVYDQAADTSVPRRVVDLIGAGERVRGAVEPGDLLFFDTVGGPSHVGIAIDADRFIHAASAGPKTGVIVSSLTERYYKTRFLQARSILGRDVGMTGFLFEIDSEPIRRSVAGSVTAGVPVTISVRSSDSGTRFVSLVARRDGSTVFTKRIRVRGDQLSTPIRLVPDQGLWELVLNAGHDRVGVSDLAILSFRAGVRP